MNPVEATGQLERVEAFQRKHRVGLLTLVFTDIVGSTQLKQALGDREAVALTRELARIASGWHCRTDENG